MEGRGGALVDDPQLVDRRLDQVLVVADHQDSALEAVQTLSHNDFRSQPYAVMLVRCVFPLSLK